MDSSQLYPAGFAPCGLPASSTHLPAAFPEASLEQSLQTQFAVRSGPPAIAEGEDEPLSNDDMAMLERLLRGCHIYDADVADAVGIESVRTPSTSSSFGGANGAMLDASLGSDLPSHSAVEPLASQMVQHLQGSPSIDVANARCAEMLIAFQAQQNCMNTGAPMQEPSRLRSLQGANRVLLRGFRNLYKKQRQMDAERKVAEERFTSMAAELARTQAALQASERANSNLQYHLQLMNNAPRIAAGGGL